MYTRAWLSGSAVSAGSVAVGLGVAVGAAAPVDAGAVAVSYVIAERGVGVASVLEQASQNSVPRTISKERRKFRRLRFISV